MSSSGIYTRYINQYPGWFEGGDVMTRPLYQGEKKLGYFRVETNKGNTWAYCHFMYGEYCSNRITIIDHEGKKAIQHVLEYMAQFDYARFAEVRTKYQEV